ncbi:MAG: hypothetical protein M3463_14840 [Verrucomicrobiota bacterium]|nr:hypothetical protein [Verrucomicrobiota bacterium]
MRLLPPPASPHSAPPRARRRRRSISTGTCGRSFRTTASNATARTQRSGRRICAWIAKTVRKARTYDGPGLAVHWVEVEGPLNDAWPPASHLRIFGDLGQAPAPIYNSRDRVEVVSNEPLADADRILRKFVRRAFRRSVNDADIQPFVTLVEAKLGEKHSFEQVVRAKDYGFRSLIHEIVASELFRMK